MQTADMLNLPVPEAEYINEVLKPSETQEEMVSSFADRAEAVRNGNVNPRFDNMLKITNDGRKLALDQRIINDMLPDEPESKVNRCVDNQIKNSLAPTAEDIRFSISADKGFQWLECRPQSFENQKPDRKPEFESEQQKAVYWIKHFLEKGDMSANEIYCRLDNEGVSKRVARMVKTEMGIHCYQKKRRWYWSVQPEEGAVNGPQV